MKNLFLSICILTLFLCISLSFNTSAATVASGTCGANGDNLTWVYDAEKTTLTISGTGEMKSWETSADFPWEKYRRKTTKLVIGDDVTSISNYAFYGYSRLTDVTLGRKITSIGDCVFYSCLSLTQINIPATVEHLGAFVFFDCSALVGINVDNNNNFYCSEDGILFDKNKTTLIQYPPAKKAASYSVPNGITTIEDRALSYCSKLTTITMPETVEYIGDYSFYACSSLTNLVISDKVRYIGDYAFKGCNVLSTIYFPGTQEEWNTICANIGYSNESLIEAEIIFKNHNPFVHTTTISNESSITAEISAYNIPVDNYIVLGVYKNNKLIDLQKALCLGNHITLPTSKDYDTLKVMVWKDFTSAEPLCAVDILK